MNQLRAGNANDVFGWCALYASGDSDDLRDVTIINLTPEVIAIATTLLEVHPLRSMDALHVACALEWGAELFVSSDNRQITAAGKVGLKAKYI